MGELLTLLVCSTPLLLLLLPGVQCCQETAWSRGRLSPDLGSFSLADRTAPSCACCALCHQDKTCASLSFNPGNSDCLLHSSVAGYDTLTPDDNWRYYVMPNRSQHHQFCRQDTDCQTDGDSCRGRVCTDLTIVTCRVIFETFGAGDRYGGYISGMFGWLEDTMMPLACRMDPGYEGSTRLLRNTRGFRYTRETLMEHSTALERDDESDSPPHSILRLAEIIRQSGTEPTYQLKLRRVKGSSYMKMNFELPRDEPVLSEVARPGVGTITTSSNYMRFTWTMSVPFLPTSGPVLLSTNADAGSQYLGVVAREDGNIRWGYYNLGGLYYYIRE